ncbi:MAG: monovalent cation/H(+) antiporter subunit G [Candidatus Thiodiazotropha sp. LLP2]
MRMVADLFLLIGAAFTLFGAIGLIRMPDVYNRIQAGTKAVTLGSLSLLIGIALLYPSWWSKLLVIGILILITNPLGSSTIARALLMAGVKPWKKEPLTNSSEVDQ